MQTITKDFFLFHFYYQHHVTWNRDFVTENNISHFIFNQSSMYFLTFYFLLILLQYFHTSSCYFLFAFNFKYIIIIFSFFNLYYSLPNSFLKEKKCKMHYKIYWIIQARKKEKTGIISGVTEKKRRRGIKV